MLLSPDELPSSEALNFYVIYCQVIFCVTTVVVIFTLVVMTISSTQSMRVYHYYLVTEIVWSYLCDAICRASTLLSMQPLPCLAFLGRLAPLASSRPRLIAAVAIFILSGRSAAIGLQCFYRVFQSVPPQMPAYRFLHRMLNDYAWMTFFAMTFIAFACIWGPMSMSFPDQDAQKQLLLAADPTLDYLYARLPHIICFTTGTHIDGSLSTAVALLIAIPCLGSALIFAVHRQVRRSKRPERTIHLHMMLLRSLIIQAGVLYVFIVLPAYVLVLSPMLGVRAAPQLSVYIAVVYYLETNVECLMLLWCVKPYREGGWQILRIATRTSKPVQVRSRSSTN
ncbi:unnamed protein product [Bursaphelenchus xylophilus]|uniref:(pine wood nematode) hypothetical protein n=1 Tax=Bursaphelenchus xylophilus TaxID=6326 RepID=A0A1I7S6W6_BURXY|nr:unnamed protein product [Bursaphelenchus xylophilus]CAG9079671.1 unnamed protein product [Bursaphelenchus xylophilus]